MIVTKFVLSDSEHLESTRDNNRRGETGSGTAGAHRTNFDVATFFQTARPFPPRTVAYVHLNYDDEATVTVIKQYTRATYRRYRETRVPQSLCT